MTDKELADKIKEKTNEINQLIVEAAMRGLIVEIATIQSERIGDPVPYSTLVPKVSKVEIL